MFGLSKVIKAENIPFNELTMLYIGHNCGGLSTPEDYLVSYVHAHEAMGREEGGLRQCQIFCVFELLDGVVARLENLITQNR